MISNSVYDYREAGCHIFGLHGALPNGKCECGDPECNPTSLYKHPRISAWQHVPFYSDEQFQCMIEVGHLDTGFGVLVRDLIIIDVDARNGGLESYARLCEDLGIDFENESGFVVETGSQDGSLHIYFKAPKPPVALVQTHPNYKGIDFKSSGYIVGAGSKHRSGFLYEVKKGFPQDIGDPPISLIKLLEKRQHYRAHSDGVMVDVKLDELRDVVMAIQNPDGEHAKWLAVGMGLHDTTSGGSEGLELWIEWSSNFPKFNADEMHHRWDTLGKGADVISFGTLMHYAKQDGYSEPVTFDASGFIDDSPVAQLSLEKMIEHIDIRKPHGFAGTLCNWINNQCRYPRENLAVGATLFVLSCLGGIRHIDTLDGMTLNIMPFGVAGSATGKEAIFQAVSDCLRFSGIAGALHGKFKSEQEFIRNLLRHQASFYLIDEMGIELKKLSDAGKKGGAAYLSGVIGEILKVYSKAKGYYPVSGDLKEEMKEKLKLELQKVYKKMDDDGEEKHKAEELRLVEQLRQADEGILDPYFCLFGLTTPVTFDSLVNFELATNGFFGRAVIFNEKDTTPRIKKRFKPQEMPMHLKISLSQLYSGGETELPYRVECIGNKQAITTADDAALLLEEIQEYFYQQALIQKEKTGLESLCNRAYEICAKVSLLIAMPTRIRTVQDVLYGFAVAKHDLESKISLTYSNDAAEHKDSRGDALLVKITSILDSDNATGIGVLYNRLRGFSKENVNEAIAHLVKRKEVQEIITIHPTNKKEIKKYKLPS